MKKTHLTMLWVLLLACSALAQNDSLPTRLNEASPLAKCFQTIGLTDVEIVYSRPGVKNRKIWDDLVPYNEIWRAGANNITTISFSGDVMVNGQALKAGKYALFVVPEKDKWTFVFDSNLQGFGTFFYDGKTDVLRLSVPLKKAASMQESLMYSFSDIGFNTARLNLAWENVQASFTVSVDQGYLTGKVQKLAKMAALEKNADYYDICVRWTLEHHLLLEHSPEWLKASLAIKETFSNQFTAGLWYGHMRHYDEAINYLKRAEQISPKNTLVTQAFIKRFEKEKSRKL